jgi:hypothetical protein
MSGIILAIIGTYAQIVGAIPVPYNYVVFAAAMVVLGATAISTKRHKGTEEPMKVVVIQKVPVLDLQPLPHRRGLPRLPTMDDLRQKMGEANRFPLKEGVVARKGPLPTEFTHPEAKFLERSQLISKLEYNFDFTTKTKLRAKFGVIRVRSLSGTVKNCKADVRYRVLEEEGKPMDEKWISDGCLNWYSPELAAKLVVSPIDRSAWTYGINRYLIKSEETIPDGETKDLLVFYMIEDVPNVHLCSSMDSAPLGWAEKGPVKFEIELAVTGDEYPKTIWKFQGSAIWDDFSLTRVQQANKLEGTLPKPAPEKPPSTPTSEIRTTPTSQQVFVLSLAQESNDIKMREIRVRVPSGQIFEKDANFYTVAIAVPTNSANAVDFKMLFRKPNTGDEIHLYELYKIPTTGLPYMLVPWDSPNPFRPDVTFHFAGAVRMTVIKQPFTLTATIGPRLGFASFVFLYTIRDNNRVFVPTNSAWDAEMPIKFQTELWAEASNKPKIRLARFEVDARTWDNFSVTELQT